MKTCNWIFGLTNVYSYFIPARSPTFFDIYQLFHLATNSITPTL